MGVLLVSIVLAGCGSEPTTFAPNNTNSFTAFTGDNYKQADAIIAADYIISLDTSRSMRDFQQRLINKIPNAFISELDSRGVDYRIGFVEGAHQSINGEKPSYFGQAFMGNGYVSRGSTSVLDSIFAYLGRDLNPNWTNVREGAKLIMSAQGASFKRFGAQLVYVFITDCENGENGGAVSNYVNILKSHKPNGTYVSARSLVVNTRCTNLQDTVKLLNQDSDPNYTNARTTYNYNIRSNSNDADIADRLADLATDVSKKTGRFQMRGKPASGTLQVFIQKLNEAEVEIPAVNPTTGATNWRFLSSTNEVEFVVAPASSSAVRFEYSVEYRLSDRPVLSTIAVSVGGNAIANGSPNGWTYDAANNRILFHGSARPVDGAQVNVTYEIQ